MSVKLRREARGKIKRERPLMPLPEAIDGGEWQIKPSYHRRSGMAELAAEKGGRLTIPLGGGEIERALRLHEQAHIAISPREPEAWDGVDQTVLQLCEDCRVHHALLVGGFERPLAALSGLKEDMSIEWKRLEEDYQRADKARDKVGRSFKVIPPRAIVAARVMASYGTGLEKSELDAARKLDKVAAEFGMDLGKQFCGNKIRPFIEAKIAAELICERFGTPGEPDISDDAAKKSEEDDGELSKVLPELTSMPKILEALSRLKEGETDSKPSDGRARAWPTMEIIEKSRPLRMKATMRGGFKKLPDVRGRALRRVARLAQDGRVFRAKHYVRRHGGCVLIDCSGSMSLSPVDIEAILIALPAAVIATYNGSGSHGKLWVIARDGKRAKPQDLRSPMGGNVVDVPALKWLNEQKGPRYWVCDGYVTEHEDEATARVVAACHHLSKQGGVIRVPNIDSVLSREGWERVS